MTNNEQAEGEANWHVLPHDPLQELTENLWRVEGALPHFSMRRVMTIVRMSNGELLIHSAIALDAASMQRIEAWGTPSILLVPHVRHRMDAPRFKHRFPKLRVFAPPAVMKKARAVVDVAGTYADVPPDPSFSLELLDGLGESEGALVVHSQAGNSVVLNEVIFDLPPPKSAFLRSLVSVAGFGPGACVTPVVKLELVKDKAKLSAHLERLAALPNLQRLIVSHHRMSEGAEAARALRQAAATL